MDSSSPSPQTIDLEDFQHSHEMDERKNFHSDDGYDAPPAQSLIGLSSRTKLAIFISILFVLISHWRSLIEKWYTSLKFQLKHITIKEYLVNWWWTNIEYCRGAWYIGHEILRNTFFILRGGPDDSRRNGVYAGSLANQNGNRASMPDLLHDDQPSEVLEQATTIPGAPQARPPSGSKRVLNQIHQAVKEAQTEHEEVEPAFSEEINFPPGWLVFHSRLGVVHKHVADEYDRRRHHLVAEASGARRIKPHVMNTLSPHDSQSPAIGNNGSTPITAQ